MRSQILTLASCAAVALGAEVDKRAAADQSAFVSAANELISKYIPSDVLAILTPAISQAAAAASVTGDPASLFTSALEDTTLPAWFPTSVPPQFASQFGALTQAIADLRPVATVVLTSTDSAGSVVVTTVPATVIGGGVVVTSTGSDGSVITTSLPASSGIVITSTGSDGTVMTTTIPASAPGSEDGGNVVTSTGSDGSVFTTTNQPTETTETVPVTTTNSAGSTITTAATTTRPASTTSSNAAAMATANAAGLLALLGVLAAL